jgi:hypothetical protein
VVFFAMLLWPSTASGITLEPVCRTREIQIESVVLRVALFSLLKLLAQAFTLPLPSIKDFDQRCGELAAYTDLIHRPDGV